MFKKTIASLVIVAFALSGCVATIPKDALSLSPESMQLRQLQTRKFDTREEKRLLSAGAAVLQDLGFSIDESETQLGVIVGSKDRDATEAGQVAGAVFMAVMFGVAMPIDKNQKIRASLVTRKNANGGTAMRITFQRVVWDNRGQISKIESIEDEKIYQEFFEKMSKAVFLEAQQI